MRFSTLTVSVLCVLITPLTDAAVLTPTQRLQRCRDLSQAHYEANHRDLPAVFKTLPDVTEFTAPHSSHLQRFLTAGESLKVLHVHEFYAHVRKWVRIVYAGKIEDAQSSIQSSETRLGTVSSSRGPADAAASPADTLDDIRSRLGEARERLSEVLAALSALRRAVLVRRDFFVTCWRHASPEANNADGYLGVPDQVRGDCGRGS